MATRIPVASQNAHADLEAARTDAGTGPGTVSVYTGTQPATTATAASGTLLATITLNDPAYGAAVSGVATMDVDPVPSGSVVASGTPGWYRVKDSSGTVVRDGSLTSAAAVTAGDTLTITAATLTMPASSA